MKIINALDKIFDVYINGSFDINRWYKYIENINPRLKQLCVNDFDEAISTGLVTFEQDFLPIINNVFTNEKIREEAIASFGKATRKLAEQVVARFGKTVEVTIVLYLGLCNGAGWVVNIDNETYCLLGIEKIMELGWVDVDSMYGLLYHELGHVYHSKHGELERVFDNNKHKFLWQLFVEGVAMVFEQMLIGSYEYFHQDKDGWKDWCDKNLKRIAKDFYDNLSGMTIENQRYFGDWVRYNGYADVGYYLGARFVQYLCLKFQFDEILSFDVDKVESSYKEFIEV